MYIKIDLSQEEMKKALMIYVESELGITIEGDYQLKIEVKSKQNYRSEWEEAEFRGTITKL